MFKKIGNGMCGLYCENGGFEEISFLNDSKFQSSAFRVVSKITFSILTVGERLLHQAHGCN